MSRDITGKIIRTRPQEGQLDPLICMHSRWYACPPGLFAQVKEHHMQGVVRVTLDNSARVRSIVQVTVDG